MAHGICRANQPDPAARGMIDENGDLVVDNEQGHILRMDIEEEEEEAEELTQ